MGPCLSLRGGLVCRNSSRLGLHDVRFVVLDARHQLCHLPDRHTQLRLQVLRSTQGACLAASQSISESSFCYTYTIDNSYTWKVSTDYMTFTGIHGID